MENLKPTISYGALVGQVILRERKRRKLEQTVLAGALGVSQSAYSRLEQGESSMSLGQLRTIASTLGLTPGQLLHETDKLAILLESRGAVVTDEKKVEPGAALLALGILVALIAAGGK